MKLSVIIPTFNREGILLRCLSALSKQTGLSSEYEVLVIDDGSGDNTTRSVATLDVDPRSRVRLLRQSHKGPAAARNLGVREAQSDLILFIGDDIIAAPTLLVEHAAWHERHPEENTSVLGYVTWSPEIEVTPFMHWLENGGPQFKYWGITDPLSVGWRHLITANISFKRRFLLEHGLFDERFLHAAYEDTELGYRLHRRGLRIVYNKNAVGYHFHAASLDDVINKVQKVAPSRRLFYHRTGLKRQELTDSRTRLHRILSEVKFWLFRQAGRIAGPRWLTPNLYSYLLDKARSKAEAQCQEQ